MNANLRARLDAEIPPIYARLLAMAELMVRRSGWRRRFDQDRAGVAEDLLHDAVLRTPKWIPDKVNLWGFLVGAMRSIISNATNRPENQTRSLDEPLPGTTVAKVETLVDRRPNAEEVIGHAEDERVREEALLAAAGDDPVLLKYVEAVWDRIGGPAEIAKHLRLPAEAVYQAHRKICRHAKAGREASDELAKAQG